jgi:carbonic anhydrase
LIPEGNTEDDTLTINGIVYTLAQFHFHSLSEHTEVGNHSDMETHFVFKSAEGHLAVIGAFIDDNGTSSNLELHKIFSTTLPDADDNGSIVSINVADLLPNSTVYSYSGSFTTPPCTEGVAWNIYTEHIHLSPNEIDSFQAKYDDNYRPVTGEFN